MHEYQITMRIIQIAEERARQAEAAAIKAIDIVIGEYSGCVADSVRLYFDIYSAGSMCENAALNIETVKPMLRCKICGEMFERRPFEFGCTKEGCTGQGEPTEVGREFYIRSIKV